MTFRHFIRTQIAYWLVGAAILVTGKRQHLTLGTLNLAQASILSEEEK